LSADPRQALHDVEVILGQDVMSGREFLVFGSETLEKVVQGGKPVPLRSFGYCAFLSIRTPTSWKSS
jgi:hypothetical protein